MYITLQMKDRWESNINGWFPFMYSQKWNCYFRKTSVSQFLHSYIFERFIYLQYWSVVYSCAGKYVDLSWEYINHSQTHECGNWDWGRAIPRKGMHKWDFCCTVSPLYIYFFYLFFTRISSGTWRACLWAGETRSLSFSPMRWNSASKKTVTTYQINIAFLFYS